MKDLSNGTKICILVLILVFLYFFIKGINDGLVALVVSIVHFFTGSSEGSKQKDATIASQLPSPPQPNTVDVTKGSQA